MPTDQDLIDPNSTTPDAMEAQLMAAAGVGPDGKPLSSQPAAPAIADPAASNQPSSAPPASLHRGFLGDIKSPEELVAYTKNLEDTVVRQAAAQNVPAANTLAPVPQKVQTGPTIDEEIQSHWFSDPSKAQELIIKKVESRLEAKKAQETQYSEFMSELYQKNPDLKRVERVVQSVMREKAAVINTLRTKQECLEFISREARDIVSYVSKASGTEVRLPSEPAVTLGASGESRGAPQAPTAQPVTFIDQIRNGQRRRSGTK